MLEEVLGAGGGRKYEWSQQEVHDNPAGFVLGGGRRTRGRTPNRRWEEEQEVTGGASKWCG